MLSMWESGFDWVMRNRLRQPWKILGKVKQEKEIFDWHIHQFDHSFEILKKGLYDLIIELSLSKVLSNSHGPWHRTHSIYFNHVTM